MKVLKVLDAKLILADIEVNLGKEVRHAVTLCAKYNGKVIPLNTADGRPILMTEENALNKTVEEESHWNSLPDVVHSEDIKTKAVWRNDPNHPIYIDDTNE